MNKMTGLISTNYSAEYCEELVRDRSIGALPFGGRYKMVDFPLSNMVNSGISILGLVVPSNFSALIEHVGAGKEWNLDRKSGGMFILPGSAYGAANPKGRFLLKDITQNSAFLETITNEYLILSASSKIFNIDYNDVLDEHMDNDAEITLVYKNGLGNVCKNDYTAEIDSNKRILQIDKTSPSSCNCLLDTILINMDVLEQIISCYENYEHLDLMDIISDNLLRFEVYGYEFKGFVSVFNDINSYLKANQALLHPHIMKEIFNMVRPISTKIYDAPPTKYAGTAEVKNSIISTGCLIKGHIEDSIVFRNVTIEEGAFIKNAVIMEHCRIGKGSHLENAVMDRSATIGENIKILGDENTPIVIEKNKHL